MAKGYVSWGQRKALGKRYSEDPALTMDRERLAEEYAMMPERARLAESQRQFNMAMANREQERQDRGSMGMMSTAGNIAGLGLQAYKLGLFDKAAPAIKSGISSILPNAAGAIPSVVESGVGMLSSGLEPGMEAAMKAGVDISGSIVPNTVNGASSGMFSGITSAVSATAPYMQIHAAREIGQQAAGSAFNEAGRTMKNAGGLNAQAGEAMQSWLGNPIKDSSNLEDVPGELAKNVLPSDSSFNPNANWELKSVGEIFNPVGKGFDLLKEGIGGLVSSIFG